MDKIKLKNSLKDNWLIITVLIMGLMNAVWVAWPDIFALACLVSIIILVYGIINPITDMMADMKAGKRINYWLIGFITFSSIYLVAFIHTYYNITNLYPIGSSPLYWYFNLVFILLAPYLLICYIRRVILKNGQVFSRKKLSIKDAKELLLLILIGVLFMLYIGYKFHSPYSSLDFARLEVPQEINMISNVNTAALSRKVNPINITDKSFLEQLKGELANNNVENIRGLELINYAHFYSRRNPFYILFPVNMGSMNIISNQGKEFFIKEIAIYDRRAIVRAYAAKNIFQNRIYTYRISLSEEFLKVLYER